MFERYTEKARRVIFFARYEASQVGSTSIHTEHLLLGLFREDRPLMQRALLPDASAQSLRQLLAERTPKHAPEAATTVDLPLSNESKRVLLYAAQEAEQWKHPFIGTDHILLGLMREKTSVAAEFLAPLHVDPQTIREAIREPGAAAELRPATVSPRFYYGKYRGVVLNNIDPEQCGRLQADVPAVSALLPMTWAIPCTPYPAGGAPVLAVPPVGSSVWVEFEGGSPNSPIWTGCFWNTGETPLLKLP